MNLLDQDHVFHTTAIGHGEDGEGYGAEGSLLALLESNYNPSYERAWALKNFNLVEKLISIKNVIKKGVSKQRRQAA